MPLIRPVVLRNHHVKKIRSLTAQKHTAKSRHDIFANVGSEQTRVRQRIQRKSGHPGRRVVLSHENMRRAGVRVDYDEGRNLLDGNPGTRAPGHRSPGPWSQGIFLFYFLFFLAGVHFFQGLDEVDFFDESLSSLPRLG
jgi:hypothetical protein